MNDVSPWLVTCGLLCIWPLFWMMITVLILRGGVRLRSPFYRSVNTEAAGYAKADPKNSPVLRRIAQDQAQQKGS